MKQSMSMNGSEKELYRARATHFEELADKLARFVVAEWYGIGDRDVAHKAITELGWESGLSEDTYFEMHGGDYEDE